MILPDGSVPTINDGTPKIPVYGSGVKSIEITLTENLVLLNVDTTSLGITGDFEISIVGTNYESINNGNIRINNIVTNGNYFNSITPGANTNVILCYAAGYINNPFFSVNRFKKLGNKYQFETHCGGTTTSNTARTVANHGLIYPDISSINSILFNGFRWKIGTIVKINKLD